jgi:hypothetical protein
MDERFSTSVGDAITTVGEAPGEKEHDDTLSEQEHGGRRRLSTSRRTTTRSAAFRICRPNLKDFQCVCIFFKWPRH